MLLDVKASWNDRMRYARRWLLRTNMLECAKVESGYDEAER
jgi:hypothetical protein